MELGKERGEEQTEASNRTGQIGDRGLVRAVNDVTYPTLASRHRTGKKEQISLYKLHSEHTDRRTDPYIKEPPFVTK